MERTRVMQKGLGSALLLVGLLGACGQDTRMTEIHAGGHQQAMLAGFAPPLELDRGTTAFQAAERVDLAEIAPEDFPDLHHVFRLSENIVCGGEPLSTEAFQRLADQGIKTVISVDGKVPEHETAAELGLRYVHIPIQYSGITARQRLQLAKSFRELDGPFYVHCFHGKHRGPAAAAVGRIVIDGTNREQAIAEMRQWAGTSERYEGLYQAIAVGDLPEAEATSAFEWEFEPAHKPGGFLQSMVKMTRTEDNLELAKARAWQSDPEHPDIDALNESEILLDALIHSRDLAEAEGYTDTFLQGLEQTIAEARKLRAWLKDSRAGEKAAAAQATQSFEALKQACDQCHVRFRNDG